MTYGTLFPAQHAHADLPSLSWTAPAGCPESGAVRKRIAAWLGKPDADGAPDAPVRASGVVTRSRSGYKLTLTVTEDGVSGTRRLTGKDCQQLSETAAFLIAVSSDPNAAASAPPEDSAPPPPVRETEPAAAPPAKEPTPPAPPAAQATPPAPSREDGPWSLYGAGFGGVWQSKLPDLQALPGGSIGAAYRILHVELRGAVAYPREHHILTAGGDGVARVSTQFYGLATCALWQISSRLRAGPCGTVSLLRTKAHSKNIIDKESVIKLWSVFGLGAQAAITVVRHLELFGEGGAATQIYDRPRFTVDNTAVTSARIAYYGWVGARIRWGLPPRARP